MHIVQDNIWNWVGRCDALCITTNGIVKSNGELVMGAGIAKQARDWIPGLARAAGQAVRKNGLRTELMGSFCKEGTKIVLLPTKNHWRDPSPLELVLKSMSQLEQLVDERNWRTVAFTPPGCGHGGHKWSDIQQHIRHLDDRFVCVRR